MSEYDEVLGLKAIRKYRELWESDLIVGFILDAKDEYLIFLSPEDGWHDTTNGAVSEVIRELGGRLHLDDVDTPEDLLEVVNSEIMQQRPPLCKFRPICPFSGDASRREDHHGR